MGELVDRLEKNGIPYVIQAGTALQLLEDSAIDFGIPQPWEARVWVLGSRQKLATEIFERLLDERNLQRGSHLTNR